MARIAIVVVPLFGHISTTLSVGQVLINRGHEVTWVTLNPMNGLQLPKKGKIQYTNDNDARIDELIKNLKNGRKKTSLDGVKYVIEDILIPLNERMYKGLVKFVDLFKPDLILHDEQTYTGAIVAYKLQISYVTNYSVPSGIFESIEDGPLKEWYFSLMRQLQLKLGVKDDNIITHSRRLGLVFCPKSFNELNDLLPHQQFVGPCIDIKRNYSSSFDASKLDKGRKVLFVSIGTLLLGEAQNFFQLIVNDFQDEKYSVIVSAKPDLLNKWPNNFIVQENLPQLEVLDFVNAVITHGGANTVCESIGKGKPLVVVPMAYDQFHLAAQIEKSRVGARLKYKRLKPFDLRKACDTILNERNNYISNVEDLSKKFIKGGGATSAVNYIENLILDKGNL
jgi:MGT family glycosyltransferase